ncbi:MAG: class I SAM-dependent methyltransferase [Clostridia bacterium]|nr:class I SAM-dependent methyltransferase [Clostridia bacterium]
MQNGVPLNALGLSHKFMAEHVLPGDTVIDATAGRGRDTLFLARLVGDGGRVIVFDVQREAVDSTEALLRENGVQNAEVHLDSHSHMDRYAERESVAAVMFNFGWLPGGDHTVFSRKETSVEAVDKALELLIPGGVASLCIYYGKETGYDERDALLAHLKTIDPLRFSVLLCDFTNRKGEPPLLALIWKDADRVNPLKKDR